MASALCLSLSRGGTLSFMGSLFFMAVLLAAKRLTRKKAAFIPFLILFLFAALLWLGIGPIIARFAKLVEYRNDIGSIGRVKIWRCVLPMIKDYPLWGTGLGTFAAVFPRYKSTILQNSFISYAHNDYLQLIAETGIAGFLILSFGMLVFFITTIRKLLRRYDPYVISLTIGGIISIAALCLHSFVDFNLHIPANALLFFLIMGITTVTVHSQLHQGKEKTLFRKRVIKIKKKARFVLYPLALITFFYFCTVIIRPVLAERYFLRKDFSRAVSFEPGNAKYHYALGKQYFRNAIKAEEEIDLINSLNLTISEYKTAIRLNPSNSKYHQSLAWTYGQLSNFFSSADYLKLAHSEFQKAINLEPNNPYRQKAYAIWKKALL